MYQLEPGIATHAEGDILHLVISSSLLSNPITECYVESCFHIISDDKTVVTWLELKKPSSKYMSQQKFRVDKMKEKKFVVGLEAQKNLVHMTLALV